MEEPSGRRPLKTRSAAWAQALAASLAARGASPNGISVAGIVFAGIGAAAMVWGGPWLGSFAFLVGAIGIQLRLLCNMLDGLVAVEGGRKSATGDLFNEMPDRVEDVMLLVAAGYACGRSELGWLCAVLAVLTAYIRAFGASLGKGQDFSGPGAKPHRMFVLTVGCLGTFICGLLSVNVPILFYSLFAIAALTGVTVCRRAYRLYRKMGT